MRFRQLHLHAASPVHRSRARSTWPCRARRGRARPAGRGPPAMRLKTSRGRAVRWSSRRPRDEPGVEVVGLRDAQPTTFDVAGNGELRGGGQQVAVGAQRRVHPTVEIAGRQERRACHAFQPSGNVRTPPWPGLTERSEGPARIEDLADVVPEGYKCCVIPLGTVGTALVRRLSASSPTSQRAGGSSSSRTGSSRRLVS